MITRKKMRKNQRITRRKKRRITRRKNQMTMMITRKKRQMTMKMKTIFIKKIARIICYLKMKICILVILELMIQMMNEFN